MENINNWILQNGEELKEIPPWCIGFIYRLDIIDPVNGYKFYIGKKSFYNSKKVNISKKRRKLEGTRKRVERIIKESDWRDYFGSSKEVQDYIEKNGKSTISRVILKLCKSKIDLTYWETYNLMSHEVLFVDNCFNLNIMGKFYKGRISKD